MSNRNHDQNRVIEHPVLGKLQARSPVSFTFDGKEFVGYEGDTVASALLANGVRTLRVQEESGTPRGIYCNIGHCYECRVTVDHISGVRACLTEIEAGMIVESGRKLQTPFKNTENDRNQQISFQREADHHA